MLDTFATAATVAAFVTASGFAITRAGKNAGQATVILSAVATALGMLVAIGALTRLDADGPSVSRADARPDYGMSWRPPARLPVD